jgi:hypothetical protein
MAAPWQVATVVRPAFVPVEAAPLLIERLSKSQSDLLRRLRSANSNFDALASKVGIHVKEGA